jgi:hypothetical protein
MARRRTARDHTLHRGAAADRERLSRRVGATPKECLAWAVHFAQRDPDTMTVGDWANAEGELRAFLGVSVGPFAPGTLGAFFGVARENIQGAHRALRAAIIAALRHEPIPLGRTTETAEWRPDLGGRYAIGLTLPEVPSWTARQFVHLLAMAGDVLRVCPAPPPRGQEGETCGTWFVQMRPQGVYCSPRCQSRATTRAYMAAQEKPPRRRTARRKEHA